MVVASTACEVLWIKSLLEELGEPISSTPTIQRNNINTTYLCFSPILHLQMKHVEVDVHFVLDKVQFWTFHASHRQIYSPFWCL